MKLQFLGDSRDSFKWDLLHFVVTTAAPPFDELYVVPMLTPDESTSHGGTPPERFDCRPQVLSLLRELRLEPRHLRKLERLGRLRGLPCFRVTVYRPEELMGNGSARASHFANIPLRHRRNSVVFFDPDNGFETVTQHGRKWLRLDEVNDALSQIPGKSALVVFQFRPQGKSWREYLPALSERTGDKCHFGAIYEGHLAFIFLSKARDTFDRLLVCLSVYRSQHSHLKLFTNQSQKAAP